MSETPNEIELRRIYGNRFGGKAAYRMAVWSILAEYFSRWIPPSSTVLDLGAGYCEFVNNVAAQKRFAMDLNPEIHHRADADVTVLHQNCCDAWPLDDGAVDAVFTSNFLEHLPGKSEVQKVLLQAFRVLRPGGCFIAVGPNIKCVPGAYWDFFDHYVELTELSLAEALSMCGYRIEARIARFLPYTMSDNRQYPLWTLRTYLAVPLLWRAFGKQFLVISRKPCDSQKETKIQRDTDYGANSC